MDPVPTQFFRTRRFLLYLLLLFLLPTACCIGSFVFPVVLNNFRLQQFAKNLYAYPLPPHTEVINRSAKVGLLGGNGNHCDFEARQYMRTALSQEEIEAYYQGVRVPQIPFNFAHVGWGDRDVFLFFDGTEDGFLLFLASVSDTGYPAGLDLRCN